MKKLFLAAVTLFAASLHAQEVTLSEYLRSIPPALGKLQLRLQPQDLGMFSHLSNGLFKPKGAGPFPTVVLGHTCGGVAVPHMKVHAQSLLDAGYAVMLLDSFGPRGLKDCRGQTTIGSNGTVRDAYQALEALSGLPELDSERIFFVGYSWGGVVAPMLASPQSAQVFGAARRYRALVSNYGGCTYPVKPGGKTTWYLARDMDRPLLMLMAGKDKEFRPSDCFPLLPELKEAGKPIEWQVYEGMHHAWDQPEQRGSYSAISGAGETSVYLYNEQTAIDASRRMIEFLGRQR